MKAVDAGDTANLSTVNNFPFVCANDVPLCHIFIAPLIRRFLLLVETPPKEAPEPENVVAASVPLLGLYVRLPSDSSPMLPPSISAPAVKMTALASSVDSLSVIVTVVATVATSAVPVTSPVISPQMQLM